MVSVCCSLDRMAGRYGSEADEHVQASERDEMAEARHV